MSYDTKALFALHCMRKTPYVYVLSVRLWRRLADPAVISGYMNYLCSICQLPYDLHHITSAGSGANNIGMFCVLYTVHLSSFVFALKAQS
jgi:hypothetical protein